MYWTLSEIRGLEAAEAGGVGGGYRGRSSLATVWRPGICSQQTSSCSSLHSARIPNHSANFTPSSTLYVVFYHYYLLLAPFLHQSKRFSTEKSDILRGNLLMWDRPGCNIGWRRDGVGSIIFQRPPPAAATPTLFIINLEHFYLAQSYTAFYSAMNVILLPSSGGTWLPVITSDYLTSIGIR